MDSESNGNTPTPQEEGVDFRRLLLRKDRPLPKPGCSWAFYLLLLALIVYLVVTFIHFKSIPADDTAADTVELVHSADNNNLVHSADNNMI